MSMQPHPHGRNQTLSDRLDWCVAMFGDREALIDGTRRLTWRQVKDISDNLAANLLAEGIRPGEVVSVQLPNWAEFIFVHFALARIGAVLNTVHMAYRRREVSYVLGFSDSVAAIVAGGFGGFDYVELMAGLVPGLPKLRRVFVARGSAAGMASLSDLLDTPAPSAARTELASLKVEPDDWFTLWYTSGTEAEPKGVVHTHNTLVSNGFHTARELWMNPADVILSISPLTHAFGLCPLYLSVNSGACQVLVETFSPPGYLELAERERATFGFVVPAALLPLLGQATSKRLALRTLLVSGSSCPPGAIREAAGMFAGQMAQLWGMTETECGTYTRPEDELDMVATSSGRACPGSEVAAFDDDRHMLPAGEVGELGFRGASLSPAYFKNEQATRASRDEHGWFFTGDLASVDERGYMRIAGRKKDVINRGSVKFNPVEVEDLLLTHPKIVQAALVAMPDERLGERACAFVALKPSETLTLAEIMGYLTEQGIAKYKLPERLEILPELPATPTRKIQKSILRQRLSG